MERCVKQFAATVAERALSLAVESDAFTMVSAASSRGTADVPGHQAGFPDGEPIRLTVGGAEYLDADAARTRTASVPSRTRVIASTTARLMCAIFCGRLDLEAVWRSCSNS